MPLYVINYYAVGFGFVGKDVMNLPTIQKCEKKVEQIALDLSFKLKEWVSFTIMEW